MVIAILSVFALRHWPIKTRDVDALRLTYHAIGGAAVYGFFCEESLCLQNN